MRGGDVTIADIAAAHDRIKPHIRMTPLIESESLSGLTGGRIFLKAESLQRAGSFKFRGAMNALLDFSDAERRRGVAAFSSGNHAAAIAAAARVLGIPAHVVMPLDAPASKIEMARGYGARVTLYDRERDDRLAIASKLVDESGLRLVPPFDDPAVVAGQGTAALEAVAQAGHGFDVALMNCSGGGLVTGCAVALRDGGPTAEIVAVEPEGFGKVARSLAQGRIVANAARAGSICDALLAPAIGELPFRLMQRHSVRTMTASDSEVIGAIRHAFGRERLVLEPGGAAALAVVLALKIDLRGRSVLILCSGGNIDAGTFARFLSAGS